MIDSFQYSKPTWIRRRELSLDSFNNSPVPVKQKSLSDKRVSSSHCSGITHPRPTNAKRIEQ